jgi:ABC-type oligopeptide transport system substrate-binding subunit
MQRLVRDEAPLIPVYENARLYVQHPALQGVVRAPFFGDPNLRHAWIGAR